MLDRAIIYLKIVSQTTQCVADADTTIARVALDYHSSGKYVVVNTDDFDVLCLLMHHLDTTETFVESHTSYRLFIHSFRT